jgi:dethiobiotin synthetase/adenosylmethionine--8-amino-7-oxononanoate aminotransferase
MDKDGSWNEFKNDWKQSSTDDEIRPQEVWSVWSHGLVNDLSHAESVDSVFAIGAVLSISLKDAQGAGEHPKYSLLKILSPIPTG